LDREEIETLCEKVDQILTSKDTSIKKKKAKSISPTKKPNMTMIQELSIKTKNQSPIMTNTDII